MYFCFKQGKGTFFTKRKKKLENDPNHVLKIVDFLREKI